MINPANDSQGGQVVSLADEEGVKKILVETIFSLWKTVNTLARLRPSRHPHYRVSIFGSARVQADTQDYADVKRLAGALTRLGCEIITGGGPGLMQAANEGAAEADPDKTGRSKGICIELPFEQSANPFVEQCFDHGTFFTRLHHFVLTSDAFIVTPGGIGTVLETMMVWQLLQVRHLHGIPLILVGPMWKGLVDWAGETMLKPSGPLISPEDLTIPTCVATVDEALALLTEEYARWQANKS